MFGRRMAGLLVGIGASAALLGGVCLHDRDLWNLTSDWRFWDDTAIAIGRYLDRVEPASLAGAADDDGIRDTADVYRRLVRRGTLEAGIRPCEFWRTIELNPFRRHRQPYSVPALEDPGRAILVAVGYVAMGGIVPYLPIWIAPLFSVPMLLWLSWELFDAEHGVAAGVFLVSFVLSLYVIDTLTLPHSAVGFYLVALLALAALSAHALLGSSRSVPRLIVMVVVAGSVFGVAAVCRSGTLFLAPGFILASVLGFLRIDDEGGGSSQRRLARRFLAAAGLSILFLSPYLALRPAQHHNAWAGVWEGLGDYGEAHGYSWYDADAQAFLARRGVAPFAGPKDVSPAHEAIFRDAVLSDLAAHPFWYGGILGRRFVHTVTFRKVASTQGPRFHYKYVIPADRFGVARRQVRLPLWCLWSPIAAFVAAWAATRGHTSSPERACRFSDYAKTLLCLSVGALALPVLLTTAGGIETEAFVLASFLALAFVVEEVVRHVRPLQPTFARATRNQNQEPRLI